MLAFLEKIFGGSTDRELKNMRHIVDEINGYEKEMTGLSDSSLSGKTEEFKRRLRNGETLDELLPEAFAVVREASCLSLIHI